MRNFWLTPEPSKQVCLISAKSVNSLICWRKTYGKQFPNVPWHDMYGVRCRIIHDYDGVNFALVWQIIRNDLPKLIKDLNEILKK